MKLITFAIALLLLGVTQLSAQSVDKNGKLHLSHNVFAEIIPLQLNLGGSNAVSFNAKSGQHLWVRIQPYKHGRKLALYGPIQANHDAPLQIELQDIEPLHSVKLEGIGSEPFDGINALIETDGLYVLEVQTEQTGTATALSIPNERQMTTSLKSQERLVFLLDENPKAYAESLPLHYQPDVEASNYAVNVLPGPIGLPYPGLGTLKVAPKFDFIDGGRNSTIVFQSPSKASKVVGELLRGTEISEEDAISHLLGWYAVSIEDDQDGIGWISGENLEVFNAPRFANGEGSADSPPPTHDVSIDVSIGEGPVRWSGVLVDEVRALTIELVEGTHLKVLRSEAMSEGCCRWRRFEPTWTHLFDPDGELLHLFENGTTARIPITKTGAHRLELFATGRLIRDEVSGEPIRTEVLLAAE